MESESQVLPSFGTSFSPSSQMGSSNNKRIGVPPSHPNNPQVLMGSRSNSQSFNRSAPSHSRSLSQSSVFSSFDSSLPPLSPLPSNADNTVEDNKGLLGTSAALKVNSSTDSLPPRRGHRRSVSDSVPLNFAAMIQSSPQLLPIAKTTASEKQKPDADNDLADDLINAYIMNMDNIDSALNSDDKDLDSSRVSGNKTESSDNEVESSRVKDGLKRSAASVGSGDVRGPRHCRSVSMDSYIGDFHLDEESLKFPPLAGGLHSGQLSPGNSIDAKLVKFNLEFGSSEFTEVEMKKIMANDKLTEIAMTDPKRAKRILANRLSAARSKERKMRYISELEQKVQTLQTEATTLSAQVMVLQRDSATLTSQNNELKFCLQAMEQQAKLKDALNEALVAEVQRLRVTAAEMRGETHQRLRLDQQMLKLNLNTYQMQQGQQKQSQQMAEQRQQRNQPQSQPQNGEAGSKGK